MDPINFSNSRSPASIRNIALRRKGKRKLRKTSVKTESELSDYMAILLLLI